ncbi:hypothetical protein OKW96_05900 [Sphingobacterium sp. KU25419]|nr:hypothetical protein OKW96_05900 [Sphingobacterium sp. KU25419]
MLTDKEDMVHLRSPQQLKENIEMKTIVISAVNLVEAGTLAILKDCLTYLSQFNAQQQYRIIAIVYKKELVNMPNIEYIETQWPKKRWINRLGMNMYP